MKEVPSGRSRGFGFVTFDSPSVADSIVNRKHSVDGKLVDVKRAVPRDSGGGGQGGYGGGMQQSQSNSDPRNERIFVVLAYLLRAVFTLMSMTNSSGNSQANLAQSLKLLS